MAVELASSRTTPTAVEPVAAQRRRLMAVMLADVVNYSRMMSRSEDETHARFASHARELIEPTCARYACARGDPWGLIGRSHNRQIWRKSRAQHGRRNIGRVFERGRRGA